MVICSVAFSVSLMVKGILSGTWAQVFVMRLNHATCNRLWKKKLMFVHHGELLE